MSAGAPSDAGCAPHVRPPLADALKIGAFALTLRLAVVMWAARRIPPVADGTFYDTIARRIARGLGYTWLWPDGTVTYAAHYPVGYPAFVGALYRVFGAHPAAAMVGNAVVGTFAAIAVHRVVARGGGRATALLGALLVAVHPGLVSYTPALMTEGMTASLVAVSMWFAVRASERPSLLRLATTGLAIAAASYVRPQSLVLVGLLPLALLPGAPTGGRRLARAAVATVLLAGVAGAVIAPWTARNCERMGRCAIFSVNDGWNLLIGTDPAARGTWAPVDVPAECRDVFDEAEKNHCFGQSARRRIASAPGAWLALAPAKLGATFDYAGAGPWYLRAANPAAVSERTKVILGACEVVFERATVAACLAAAIALARRGRAIVARLAAPVALAGMIANFVPTLGYVAILALVVSLGLALLGGSRSPPPAFALGFVHLTSTVAIHVVFFGAGRYSLVTFPALCALAAFGWSAVLSRRARSAEWPLPEPG